jgi:hypothetical protein
MSLPLIGTVVCARAPGHPKAPVINIPAVKIAAALEYNLRFFVVKLLPGFTVIKNWPNFDDPVQVCSRLSLRPNGLDSREGKISSMAESQKSISSV